MFKFGAEGFTIADFEVRWYGVLIAMGILLGTLLAARREKRLGIKKDTIYEVVLFGVPCAIIGARVYYVAFSWDKYASDLLSVFDIRSGGLAIYGGIIGALACGMVYSRVKKLPFSKLLDLTAPSFALGQAIGRWGNYFNQEAYGGAIECACMRFFPLGVYIDVLEEWRYATFFYESVWCALIVAVLLIAERKGLFRKSGDVFLWYVLLYVLERALVEGLRTDSLYLGTMRVSQWLSMLAAFTVCAVFSKRVPRRAFAGIIPMLLMCTAMCFGCGIGAFALAIISIFGCGVCYFAKEGK